MAQRVKSDQLTAAIDKILQEYGDNVKENLTVIVEQMSKKGAKQLRSESASRGWGDTTGYDKGWTSRVETGRFSAQGTIYNAKVPGLPHLLEFGHALRQGGRATGKVHISTVENQLIKEFESKVKAKL